MNAYQGRMQGLLTLACATLVFALVSAAEAAATSGSSAPRAQKRVVGGGNTDTTIYPWQVAVVKEDDGSNDFQRLYCGGVLLTSRIVLTAGHCTSGKSKTTLDVVLGRTTLSGSGGYEDGIEAVHTSGSYHLLPGGVPDYDVGYIFLNNPVPLTPIKIAGPDEGALWDFGRAVEVTGWGRTTAGGSDSDTLQAATVNTITDSYCQGSGAYSTSFYPATMLCAGIKNGGTDSCHGDSGGPLQAPIAGGGYRLVGTTSWGDPTCAIAGKPGVYARVAGSTLRAKILSDLATFTQLDGVPFNAADIVGGGAQPAAAGPANDEFADAQALGAGLTASASGASDGATKQVGEPLHAAAEGGSSVWYRWTAPASGTLTIDLCGSDFDTVLGVYSGSALGSLTPVASNDDGCSVTGGPSKVSFHATAGAVYSIAVDGKSPLYGDADQGQVELDLDLGIPPTPSITAVAPDSPANDNTPLVTGSAGDGLTVELFSSADCSGAPIGSGSAAQFASPGLTATVPDDAATTLHAAAVDGDGGVSLCSAGTGYVEDSSGPAMKLVKRVVKGKHRRASVSFSATDATTPANQIHFRCALDGAALKPCHARAGYRHLRPGHHKIRVLGIDALGNQSAPPLRVKFRIPQRRK